MKEIRLTVGGRAYSITTAPDQEAHVRAMAEIVDQRLARLGDATSQNDAKNLLFAALFLADELHEHGTTDRGVKVEESHDGERRVAELEDRLADALDEQERLRDLLANAREQIGGENTSENADAIAARLEDLAAKLENRADALEGTAPPS